MLVIFNLIFIAFIGAIVVFIRQYRLKKKAHLAQLETVDQLHKEELLKTQMEIQMQTMKHIGREIHDNVGQKLTLSSLYLQQLPFKDQTPEVAESIQNIGNIINESLDDLRHLSRSLTDDTIENLSISDLIKNECDRVSTLKKYRVTFKGNLNNQPILYQVKSVLLRITQEFIQNSMKHADCKNIDISINQKKGKLQLSLKDDGKGFNIKNPKSSGIGLKNMEKRVRIINGVFDLHSDTNTGTKLTIEIPI